MRGQEIEIDFWKEKNKILEDELNKIQGEMKKKEEEEEAEKVAAQDSADSLEKKELLTKITLLETQVLSIHCYFPLPDFYSD